MVFEAHIGSFISEIHLKAFNQRYSWENMGGRAEKSTQDSTAIELSSDYSQKPKGQAWYLNSPIAA